MSLTDGIRKLSLFGSVLRDDFDPARSDVDVLAELLPTAQPGWEFFGWHEDLAPIIGRKVDLHTPNSLSQYFRDDVPREALTVMSKHDPRVTLAALLAIRTGTADWGVANWPGWAATPAPKRWHWSCRRMLQKLR